MGKMELLLVLMLLTTVNGLSGDTIAPGESLLDNETIVSEGGSFVFGFFTPNNSNSRYLGIWYNNIEPQMVVWFANMSRPLNSSSGILNLTADGELILFDNKTGDRLWSTPTSDLTNPVVQLLDTGNLVLNQTTDQTSIVWQSFQNLCDTLLPGMQLGVDRVQNLSKYLRSRKSDSDPLNGDYTYRVDPHGYGVPEVYLRNDDNIIYRSGPWNGYAYSGRPEMKANPDFQFNFTVSQNDIYFTFINLNNSIKSRIVLADRKITRYNWFNATIGWIDYWHKPSDDCDDYAKCGPNAVCTYTTEVTCHCLDGYIVKSEEEWRSQIYNSGCVRNATWNCSEDDEFYEQNFIKLPDTGNATIVDDSLIQDSCQTWCSRNCSCMAYAVIDQTGCVAWMGDLKDIKSFDEVGDTIYIRSQFSSPVSASPAPNNSDQSSSKVSIKVVVPAVIGSLLVVLLFLFWLQRYKRKKGKLEAGTSEIELLQSSETKTEKTQDSPREQTPAENNANPEIGSERMLGVLPMFDLTAIKAATNDFAANNIIGEGGFGVVYKGQLHNGLVIAVKRFMKLSLHSLDVFKNEVKLIANLQHINLIGLLGCCIDENERILVLEYMENGSLDTYIYDETKGVMLDWQRRLGMITEVAQGLLYLHRDSKLKIIHRDLKLSNILLDHDLNPKISDFGIARIFEGGPFHENATTRPIGTLPYMAPEYISAGIFSIKSDVFSFGVILFEILSGKKNKLVNLPDTRLNLLGTAYQLWKDGRSLEILDPTIGSSYPLADVLRCIRVGLLCVQEKSEDRPTMDKVVRWLSSEDFVPDPCKGPANSAPEGSSQYQVGDSATSDGFSSTLQPR